MKTIIFNNTEAKQSGKITIVRPLGDQPPDGYVIWAVTDKNVCFIPTDGKHSGYDDPRRIGIPLQYPVGKYGVRETWAEKWYHAPGNTWMGYRYKADYTPHELSDTMFKWQSPATMPHKAIRDHVIIESDTVKRVQSLSTKMQLIFLNSVADQIKRLNMFCQVMQIVSSLIIGIPSMPRKDHRGRRIHILNSLQRGKCDE